MIRVFWLAALLGTIAASAADSRGWSEGTVAANSARMLEPLNSRAKLDFPDELKAFIQGPTLIIYFSPACPHCQDAAPEWSALAKRLEGRAAIVGVATGHQPIEAVQAFVSAYAIPFPVVRDTSGRIAEVMGITSTPSAALVQPKKKYAEVIDFWYPYLRGYETLVDMRVSAEPWAAFSPDEYHGTSACAACHVEEAESWALTPHAIAWGTLVASKRDDDPQCTGCHVTGAGQATGWDGDKDSILVAVGCEACHGPGGPHDGARTDPSSTCTGCHDDEHSIAFRYEKGLPLLDHFRAVSMDDTAFRAAREVLVGRQGEHPLLAFPDGEKAGSQACAACHPGQDAWWAASTHRDVGCESCHGPGQQHVAAGGGKGNIEDLGADCPVCVLDALCTSCHTPAKDPEWKLEEALAGIAH